MLIWFLIASFVLISVIEIAILIRKIKKLKEEVYNEIKERLKNKNILFEDSFANFFGQKSLGYLQSRGNGPFFITEDEIVFTLLLPKTEISIPRKNIIAIETGKTFLGKTKGRPLLIVNFKVSDNTEDAAAWLLNDLEKAKAILTAKDSKFSKN